MCLQVIAIKPDTLPLYLPWPMAPNWLHVDGCKNYQRCFMS